MVVVVVWSCDPLRLSESWRGRKGGVISWKRLKFHSLELDTKKLITDLTELSLKLKVYSSDSSKLSV